MPAEKCQDWDSLLSLCPAGCACNSHKTCDLFLQLFTLCFLSVFGMWTQAYRRHYPDPCLNAKLLIPGGFFFPEALILPQFERFRRYAEEKTSVSQGHSKCIGSFLRWMMIQISLSLTVPLTNVSLGKTGGIFLSLLEADARFMFMLHKLSSCLNLHAVAR